MLGFYRRLCIITGVFFLLTGCSFSETRSVPVPILVPQFQQLSLRNDSPGDHPPMASIRIEYVTLRGLDNKRIEDSINSRIRDVVGMNRQFDGRADFTVNIRRAAIDGRQLTVVVESEEWQHSAANSKKTIIALLLDLDSGDEVRLADVFLPSSLQQLNSYVRDWMTQQDFYTPFESLQPDQCFYRDGDFLYLCFSQYQIAPGAVGNVLIALPYVSLEPLLRSDSPL